MISTAAVLAAVYVAVADVLVYLNTRTAAKTLFLSVIMLLFDVMEYLLRLLKS